MRTTGSHTLRRRLVTVLCAVAMGLTPTLASADTAPAVDVAGVAVRTFANEPFDLQQCYGFNDPFYSPLARIYNQRVCINYQATTTASVGTQGQDVAWSLVQDGTATITGEDGQLLYQGPFRVSDVGHDLGGNAQCTTPEGRAWMGNCKFLLSSIDTVAYHWEIPFVYGLDLNVTQPGEYCITSASPMAVANTGTICHTATVNAAAHQDASTGIEVAGVQSNDRPECLWIRDGYGPWVCRADAPQ